MNKMNCDIRFILAALLLALVRGISSQEKTNGPADIKIDRIEKCENNDDYPIDMPITMRKVNRTHAGFSGCLDLPFDVDEKSGIYLHASRWGDGGWKPNALNYTNSDVCKVLMTNRNDPWTKIMEAAGRDDSTCPLPKGNYCVKDVVMELDGLFPNMLYGKFRIDAEILYDEVPQVCVRAFINSDPAKAKGP